MARGSSISGNGGNGSGNDSYTIVGRGRVSRPQMVREVRRGLHPDTGIVTVGGVPYARNKPNSNKPDNIND